MPQTRSKYEFYKESSLSQQLADKIPIYQKLAGADSNLSESIGVLLTLGEFGFLDLQDRNTRLMLALLDVQRKARFATSDKVNEISKMGMQMPKREDAFFGTGDDEDNGELEEST